MTGCTLSFEALNEYVDGALDPEAELEVRRHLDACATCHKTVEALLELKRTVAASVELRPVPHSLREKLSTLGARRHPGGLGTRPSAYRKAGFAAAAAVLLATGLALWLGQRHAPSEAELLAQALVVDHVRYLDVPDAIQVASADPERLTDIFAGRVGFPLKLPRLEGVKLLGGRLCWLKGHQALLTFYENAGSRISLYLLDRKAVEGQQSHRPQCHSAGEYEVCLVPGSVEILALVAERQQALRLVAQLGNLQRPSAATAVAPE